MHFIIFMDSIKITKIFILIAVIKRLFRKALDKTVITERFFLLKRHSVQTKAGTLTSLINVKSAITFKGDKFSKKNKRTGKKSS